MKVYLADGSADNLIAAQEGVLMSRFKKVYTRMNILISFFYFKKVDLNVMLGNDCFIEPPDLFADSGAFSAYSLNKPIDIEAYADWLFQWLPRFSLYANLDDKHSWKNGLKNLRKLEDKGLTPLPVYHGKVLPYGAIGCGECNACFRRWVAMSLNGIEETYGTRPDQWAKKQLNLNWRDVFRHWQHVSFMERAAVAYNNFLAAKAISKADDNLSKR